MIAGEGDLVKSWVRADVVFVRGSNFRVAYPKIVGLRHTPRAEDLRGGAPDEMRPGLHNYIPFGRWRISDRNSLRVSSSLRKQPSIELVTAAECCFSTPRIIMHR
jgi:hypothetical protein